MTERVSLEELCDRVEPLAAYVGRKMQHVASQNWYRITDIHLKEDDLSIWFSYTTMHARTVSFLRPIAELLDGRFTIGPAQ